MVPFGMKSGLDNQNMAAKEAAKVNLEQRERTNYEGKKLPKKREMWLVYGILIIIALFMISAFFYQL